MIEISYKNWKANWFEFTLNHLEVFLMIMYWSNQTSVLPYGTCTIFMQITCFLNNFVFKYQSGISPTICSCLIGVQILYNVWPLFYFIIVCLSLRACNVLTQLHIWQMIICTKKCFWLCFQRKMTAIVQRPPILDFWLHVKQNSNEGWAALNYQLPTIVMHCILHGM